VEHSTQVEVGRRLLGHLDEKTTTLAESVYRNPVVDYTSVDQLECEMRRLFRELPLVVGLSCEIPDPGDYLTDDLSGVPVLVVRSEDGSANAAINVCRHRGARVAQGRGRAARGLSCPYHGWTYDLEGRLVGIPFPGGFEGLDREKQGLRRLAVAEKYGLVWVKREPGEELEIDGYLGGLERDLAAFRFGSYHHYETRTLRQPLNWKLVVDTFLETYHLAVLHGKTVSPILHTNVAAFDSFGRNLRLVAARRTIDELRRLPESRWDLVRHSAIVYVIFPNTVLIQQGDHLETFRVYPSPDRVAESEMYVSLYTPEPARTESARRHWDANMELLLATVEREDFPLAQRIQEGFGSGAQEFVTFGRNEPALQHYHASIRDALAREPG
jgi:phenylpropionate dioxygenase-like ring-hydroxylating dioxygenase large terminal subunit